jgi:hypothetical protein
MKAFKRYAIRSLPLLVIVAAFGPTGSTFSKSGFGNGRALVQAAATAMGGEQRLRALKSIKFETIGHIHALEQSERPEGPWINFYEHISELRDLTQTRARRTSERRHSQAPKWIGGTVVVADGVAFGERGERKFPATAQQVKDAEERNALSPERVVLTALDAKDLNTGPDIVFLGATHHVVSFSWGGGTVRLLLNVHNSFLDGFEITRAYPDDFFNGVWGDVTIRTTFTNWQLEQGIRYPYQVAIDWNGFPYKQYSVTELAFDVELPQELFAVPPEVRAAFDANVSKQMSRRSLSLGQGFDGRQRAIQEFGKDIVAISGVYTVTIVRQPDGIVIIEAPISNEYSLKVIAEAERRFPGVPLKGVISTGDAWTYIGGLREYIARGVPVYALDWNKPILSRLTKAPFRTFPDTLERRPKEAKFRFIGNKTVIGDGANRLELYPVRGSGGERMMLVHLPEVKTLYGSDLVQPGREGGFFSPQYLTEVAEVVNREKLDVKHVYAMHLDARPWSTVVEAINRAMSATTKKAQ